MGIKSDCIGAAKFEERLVTILGTKELADAEIRRVSSDTFKERFGDWENNAKEEFADKLGALRVDDQGFPKVYKQGSQFYYKTKDGKEFINRVKFPEMDPDDVYEVTNQLRYELFFGNKDYNFNSLENIQNIKLGDSIQASIDKFRKENPDEASQAKADLIEKYKDDFIVEVRNQIEDMGLTAKKVRGKKDTEKIEVADQDGNPMDEVPEDEKSDMTNFAENYTKNSKDTASVNVKLLLSGVLDSKLVKAKGEDGKIKTVVKLNRGGFLGKPKFVEFDDVWTTLEPKLADLVNMQLGNDVKDVFDLMIAEINDLVPVKPWAADLARKLIDLNKSKDSRERNKITEFFQAFSKAKLTYYVTEVNGRNLKVINATATNSRTSKIKSTWGQNFKEKFLDPKGKKLQKKADVEQILDNLKESKAKFISAAKGASLQGKMKAIKENAGVLYKSLKDLGVDINQKDFDNFVKQTRSEKKFYGEIKSLYEGAILTVENILDDNIKFSLNNEFINPFDLQRVITRLAGARALSATQLTENTIIGNEGKTYWTYATLSYLHNKINSWKQQADISESTQSIDELAALTYNKNSMWLKHLLAADVVNDSERAEKSMERIKAVELGLSSSFKSKNKNDGVDNTKITLADAINDSIVKILGKKAAAQKSLFPTIVPADKSRKMDISGFEMFETGIVMTRRNGLSIDTPTSDIFLDYFEDELNRMAEVAQEIENLPEDQKIIHYHKGNMNGIKSQLFPELSPENAPKEVKDVLYSNGRPVDSVIGGLTKTQREALRPYIEQALKDRISDTVAELKKNKIIEQTDKGLESLTLDRTLVQSYSKESSSPIHSLLGDYVVNGLISTIEYTKLFSGDPAYYKDQNDLIKRIPASYTDGLQLRLTENDHKYFNHAVVEGVEVASEYVDVIRESLTDKSIADAYDYNPSKDLYGVNTTDAQAWITPNRWKFLKQKLGQWGPDHDEVFKKMMKKEELNFKELKLAAQPLKGVYFDINQGRPVYLKYSQAVLVPALVQGTPMQKLYDKMTKDANGKNLKPKDEIHEVITLDGVKVGAKGVTKIHKDGKMQLADDFELNSNPLLNAGWKLQQDLPTKIMHQTLVGSQIQKNILSGLDLGSGNASYELNGSPKTGEEILQLITDTITGLSNIGKDKLSKKFGIVDGKITDMSSVYMALVDEFRSRGGDENIIAALEKEIPFDAIPQLAGRIQSIFMSIFNKELIKLKTNGGSFIQVSPFGIESVKDKDGNLRNGIKIVSDNYNGKGLLPPRKDKKTGKILPGQAMLPYSAVKDAIAKYNNSAKKEDHINMYNLSGADLKKILDPSALEMISYRIPNQGMSSNDALEIVGILPPELGDTIIAYDGVPAKTGSDFDIDKMFVMTHNLEFRDGKIQKVPSSMDSKKGLQNMLVDLYKSVLTSPHTYDQMMKSIDAGFLKDDIVGMFPQKGTGNLEFMSPIHQIKTKFEYLSGKFGVAQTANQLVDHVSNQSLAISLNGKLGIGHVDDKGRTSFDALKDVDGKNSISDVLSAFLNAYVDIAKDPYVSRGNHNSVTSGVTFMLIRAGVPITFINRFIGQPILKDLVEVMAMSEGKTARKLTFGKSKKRVTPYEYVRLMYGVKAKEANDKDVEKLTEAHMERFIKADKEISQLSEKEKVYQGRILDIFEFFNDHARSFNLAVNAAKSDTKGNGGGIIAMRIAENKRAQVIKDRHIIGFTNKFKNTMLGAYHDNAVKWVGDILDKSNLFLLSKWSVIDGFNNISEEMGKGLLTDPKIGAVLENAFRSYSMSGLSAFKDNNANHERLFVELPKKIQAMKGQGNFLIDELNIKISGGYDFLGLDSRNTTKSFNNRIYRAWTALLNSKDKNERQVGVDLVRYAYSQSGFNNNLNAFFSHIPHTVFSAEKTAGEIAEMFDKVDDFEFDGEFMDQMLRHNWDNRTIGNKLVPEVISKNVQMIDKKGPANGFIYNEEGFPIKVKENKRTGEVKFPRFVKMMLNAELVNKGEAFPEYGLFIFRGQKGNNPVYTRTHKLGMTSAKGSVFEYNSEENSTKSVVDRNNVPANIKKNIRSMMAELRNDSEFYEDLSSISTKDAAPSSNVREVSTKVMAEEDVSAFKAYVNKSGGKYPNEFFASNSVFKQFPNPKTGGPGKMPQDHVFVLDKATDRYNMIDKQTGAIVMTDVDLETGLQYVEVSIDQVGVTETSVVDRYSVADLKANPDKIFVFGDNIIGSGKGGQAIIRDEENAFGIPTKVSPNRTDAAYFTDIKFDANASQIDKAIAKIKEDGRPVVFPKDGLGTGLAKLKEKAPQTFEYLNKRLKEEFGFDNTTGKIDRAQEERILPGSHDYVAEKLDVFRAKIAHMQSLMDVQVIMDSTVPTSRVLSASDPRTIKAGKPVILINPDAIFTTTAIHEFAHVFIDAFPKGLNNPRIKRALKELEGTELYDEVKEAYPELSDEMFKKELLATAIGREGADIWDSKQQEGFWNSFKNWFFDFLRRTFGLNRSEVTKLTKELLTKKVEGDLLANLSEMDQQQKFGKEKDPEERKLDNTYEQILATISNLHQAIKPRTAAEFKAERMKKEGLDRGQKTRFEEVEALDKKLTKEFDKLNETSHVRALVRYANYAQDGVKSYKGLVRTLAKGGKLTPEKIKEIKFMTSVFELIPDVKQLLLEKYENLELKDTKGKRQKRIAQLDKIIADFDTINQELLGVQRRIYAETMVKNSNEHIQNYRSKYEKQYAELEAKNAKPTQNIYEWVNQKMIDNADAIEKEAFDYYMDRAKKTLADIHAATGWLVTEKNISNAEIQTISTMIDAADMEVDRWVHAKARSVEDVYKAFAEDHPGGVNTESRYKKFVEQTEDGTYLIGQFKVEFLKKYQEANSWLSRNVQEKLFADVEVSADGSYTYNGQSRSLVLPSNAFEVKGDTVFYTEGGFTFSMPLMEAVGKSERAYWVAENAIEKKTKYGTRLDPNPEWQNPDYHNLSEKDKQHLIEMRKMITEADQLTGGKQSLVEKAGDNRFLRLPGVTRSTQSRLLAGDMSSLVKDSVTDMFKKKEDEFELEDTKKAKAKDSVRRMADLSNKQKHEVPIPFRAKLGPADQSLDVHTILLMNLKEAKNHAEKKKLEATVNVVIDVMSNRLIPNHSGVQKLAVMHGFSRDKDIQLHYPKDKLPEDVKALMSIMENRIYGIKERDAGEAAGINMQKATTTLLKYAGGVALIGNFVNSFVNATTGTVNNLIEAWGGETYNMQNWKNAGVKYWKDAKHMADDFGSNTHKSKTNMMLDLFNVLGSRSSLNNNFEDNSRMKALFSGSKLRPIASAGEHMMQAKVMYAVLDGIKVLNKKGEYLDKSGRVVKDANKAATLDEVIEHKAGKDGLVQASLPKWVEATTFSPQPSDQMSILSEARGLIKKKIIDLHGNYDNDIKNQAQREWWGKMLFFLKKWMESTTLRRFRGYATARTKSEELREVDRYYSEDMKQYQEGYYVTATRFIANSLIPAVKELKFEILTADYKNMTKHEKANMRRLAAEFGMIAMTILAYAAMGGFDEEPDEDTLLARYFLRRELSELTFYLNPAETVKLMKNPSASISVLERFSKVLGQFFSPTETYDQGRNEGRLKLWVKTKKAIPFWAQTEKDYKAALRFLQIMD